MTASTDDPEGAPPRQRGGGVGEELERLASLHSSGALSDDELDRAARAVLSQGVVTASDSQGSGLPSSGQQPPVAGGRGRSMVIVGVVLAAVVVAAVVISSQMGSSTQAGPVSFGTADKAQIDAALTAGGVEHCGDPETAPGPDNSTAELALVGPPCGGAPAANYLLVYEFEDPADHARQEGTIEPPARAWAYGQFLVVVNPKMDSSLRADVIAALDALPGAQAVEVAAAPPATEAAVATAAPVPTACLGASACSFDNGIRVDELRADVATRVATVYGVDIVDPDAAVDCDAGEMPPNRVLVGDMIPCEVATGGVGTVNVRVLGEGRYTILTAPSGASASPSRDLSTVIERLEAQLQQRDDAGDGRATIDCPDIPLRAGTIVPCTGTLPDGDGANVTVLVLDNDYGYAYTVGTGDPVDAQGVLEQYGRDKFCRDLDAAGVPYFYAVMYWFADGRPDRMDAERDGVPCATVYPAADVRDVWAEPHRVEG